MTLRPWMLPLANLGAHLIETSIGLLALFLFVAANAPPQDLPWKPFHLDQPLGLATGYKLARLMDEPRLCRNALRDGGVSFAEVAPRTSGFCSIKDAVRLTGGTTPLAPSGPVLTCRSALALALWDRQVVQPAALRIAGSPAARIDHYGTYACRRTYGQAEGRVSQHAYAAAIDVGGVRLADGRRISVAADFRSADREGEFMRAARAGACRIFRTTLSPDYNAAHGDHLHLDMGPYRVCR